MWGLPNPGARKLKQLFSGTDLMVLFRHFAMLPFALSCLVIVTHGHLF
jgi:hypothetical protein